MEDWQRDVEPNTGYASWNGEVTPTAALSDKRKGGTRPQVRCPNQERMMRTEHVVVVAVDSGFSPPPNGLDEVVVSPSAFCMRVGIAAARRTRSRIIAASLLSCGSDRWNRRPNACRTSDNSAVVDPRGPGRLQVQRSAYEEQCRITLPLATLAPEDGCGHPHIADMHDRLSRRLSSARHDAGLRIATAPRRRRDHAFGRVIRKGGR